MKLSGARILLVLPQLPQDPASGAARSVRTICEILAAAGAELRAVATTASERAGRADSVAFLRSSGLEVYTRPGHTKERSRPEHEFEARGVHYRLLDTALRDMHGWHKLQSRQFDRMFDEELHSFRPDAVFGFGGLEDDMRRYARARHQGAKTIFGLRNMGYLRGADFLREMDGILTPSEFLTGLYRSTAGLESTALPIPIEMEDVVAPERDPIFVTMINPAPEKGLMIVARLAEELSVRRPDIPMLIVESRGSAGRLVQAGMLGGFDLRRHENLMMSPAMALPREIYLPTRCLLAPSTIPEAAGRVAAEALLNGIPPLVSARGGLPETCNGAGFSFPIPGEIGPDFPAPVPKEVIEPWIGTILRLEDDEEFFRDQSNRALEAGKAYLPENLAPRYVEYFRQVLDA